MARKGDFEGAVPLPPGFGGVAVIRRAIEYMERELADFVDIYYEQANVFSAIVGILGTKALDSFSNWKSFPTNTKPSSVSPTCAGGAAAMLRNPRIVLKAKPASVPGPSRRTMTTPAGTSSGATLWIPQNP